MINFNYLYNIFQNFLTLGSTLYDWLNTSVSLGGDLKVPIWTIIIASGITLGLGVRLIRAFIGD